jgi:transcriptional regulator with XRE-family HTH domain
MPGSFQALSRLEWSRGLTVNRVDHLTMSDYSGLPGVHVMADQIVAANVRYYRRHAGMTQKELGDMIGLSDKNISAIELSARPGAPARRFNADDLVRIAVAFRIPVTALLLPPEDDGISVRYLIHPEGAECLSMPDFLPYLDSEPDPGDDSPAARAYARRLASARAPDAAEAMAAARQASQSGLARAGLLERVGRHRSALAEMIADLDGQAEVIAGEAP